MSQPSAMVRLWDNGLKSAPGDGQYITALRMRASIKVNSSVISEEPKL